MQGRLTLACAAFVIAAHVPLIPPDRYTTGMEQASHLDVAGGVDVTHRDRYVLGNTGVQWRPQAKRLFDDRRPRPLFRNFIFGSDRDKATKEAKAELASFVGNGNLEAAVQRVQRTIKDYATREALPGESLDIACYYAFEEMKGKSDFVDLEQFVNFMEFLNPRNMRDALSERYLCPRDGWLVGDISKL